MKILLIIVRSDFGGGPRHVQQLIEYLDNNYEVFIACPFGDPYGLLWQKNKRIKEICTIPYRKFSIGSLFDVYKFIKKNNIRVVHSHGQGAGMYSRILKFFNPRIKVVHTFHGITNDYISSIKKLVSIIIGRLLVPLTDRFILVSKGELKLGESMSVLKLSRSHVIYNGIESSDDMQTKDNYSPEFRIVTLSRFDYQKNMDMAFDIALRLKEYDKIKFIWVGDGDDYERLKHKSKESETQIEFVGFTRNPQKHLMNASIYLSTSRFEGLPYALIEAASCSLPIVATNVTGNNEVAINNYNGFLFSDVTEAVSLIKKLYNNRTLVEELSNNSLKMFNLYFTIEKMINQLENIYNSFDK